MTYDEFLKAQIIRENLARLKKQLLSICDAIKRQKEPLPRRFPQKRFFARFAPKYELAKTPNGDAVYIFVPGRLEGVEVDLDLDFVLMLKDHLEKKVNCLEKELEEL